MSAEPKVSSVERAPTAMELIVAERVRQVGVEGWSLEHDDTHTNGEIAQAAAVYALPESERFMFIDDTSPELWPWDDAWYKPSPDNRLRELVKAGALIVAEIERLQRLQGIA